MRPKPEVRSVGIITFESENQEQKLIERLSCPNSSSVTSQNDVSKETEPEGELRRHADEPSAVSQLKFTFTSIRNAATPTNW